MLNPYGIMQFITIRKNISFKEMEISALLEELKK
jgi:hypothetical protein